MNFRSVSWPGLVAVWLVVLLSALLSRSLIPVDETRYATVAWEMWQRGDFLVPWLNGEPYSHKPPLFFWLVHAGWWLFGVQEWVVRAVAPVIALLVLTASSVLARQLWPKEDTSAWLVPWLLFGSIAFTLFCSWVQIDLLLVLFTVLGMIGLVRAGQGHGSGWLVTGIAIGLGVLSKGPVILLHVLPVALLAPLWKRNAAPRFWRGWYAGVAASVLLGAVLALAWALPAAQAGGPVYSHEIFWGQTADRMVDSFAHNHPVWWYLPWLALLFAPWCFLPRVWSDLRRTEPAGDEGLRFCLVWLVSVFVLLSLVSGKQFKYLLPLQPVFALLVAHAVSRQASGVVSARPWLLTLLLTVVGIAGIVFPLMPHKAAWINAVNPAWGGLLIVAAVTISLLPPRPPAQSLLRIALLSAFVVVVVQVGVFSKAAPFYDLREVSRLIAEAQAAGREVAVISRYHGQYGFLGRLTQPILYVPDDRIVAWARQHPDAWLVLDYRDAQDNSPQAVLTQPYRGGYLAIREARTIREEADLPRSR